MTQGNDQTNPPTPPTGDGRAPAPAPPVPPAPPDSAAPAPMPMPLATGPGATPEPIVIPAPPSMGRQALQLVFIPAIIVIAAVSVALLFAKLAGATENIDRQLQKLRESSGEGHMALNLQDPRYKNRSLAAYNVAMMIRDIKDPLERKRVSAQLVDILDHNMQTESGVDDKLFVYLLGALGQLGQQDGLEAITKRLSESSRAMVKQGAMRGLLSWPRDEEVRPFAKLVIPLLRDQDINVSTTAAAVLGQLGTPGDPAVIGALTEAMSGSTESTREVRWNSALALSKLGDAGGTRFVVEVLLNRGALAKIEQDGAGVKPGIPAGTTLTPELQDNVILSAILGTMSVEDSSLRNKVAELGKSDPSVAVRTGVATVTQRRKQGVKAAGSPLESLEAPAK